MTEPGLERLRARQDGRRGPRRRANPARAAPRSQPGSPGERADLPRYETWCYSMSWDHLDQFLSGRPAAFQQLLPKPAPRAVKAERGGVLTAAEADRDLLVREPFPGGESEDLPVVRPQP